MKCLLLPPDPNTAHTFLRRREIFESPRQIARAAHPTSMSVRPSKLNLSCLAGRSPPPPPPPLLPLQNFPTTKQSCWSSMWPTGNVGRRHQSAGLCSPASKSSQCESKAPAGCCVIDPLMNRLPGSACLCSWILKLDWIVVIYFFVCLRDLKSL